MDDDVKAAADAALVESMVRQLRDCVSVGDEMTLDHAALIDDAADWIAAEPARTAAAVAAAREEQRAVDRDLVELGAEFCDCIEAMEDAGVDATPLADRIAELEAFNRARIEDFDNEHMMVVVEHQRAEKAEAERDALLLEKAEWERASDAWVQEAHRFANAQVAPVVAERDALRAQTASVALLCVRASDAEQSLAPDEVLAAMDAAKEGK